MNGNRYSSDRHAGRPAFPMSRSHFNLIATYSRSISADAIRCYSVHLGLMRIPSDVNLRQTCALRQCKVPGTGWVYRTGDMRVLSSAKIGAFRVALTTRNVHTLRAPMASE
jgi:hypothetical protein